MQFRALYYEVNSTHPGYVFVVWIHPNHKAACHPAKLTQGMSPFITSTNLL